MVPETMPTNAPTGPANAPIKLPRAIPENTRKPSLVSAWIADVSPFESFFTITFSYTVMSPNDSSSVHLCDPAIAFASFLNEITTRFVIVLNFMMYCLLYKVFGYPFSKEYGAINTVAFVRDLWMIALKLHPIFSSDFNLVK